MDRSVGQSRGEQRQVMCEDDGVLQRGKCWRGQRKDKYTEQVINDRKVPGKRHIVKLIDVSLHAQRKITKCGKGWWLFGVNLKIVLCAVVHMCSCGSVLMSLLGREDLAGLPQQCRLVSRLESRVSSQSGFAALFHLHPKTINTKWSENRQQLMSRASGLTAEWPDGLWSESTGLVWHELI